MNSDTVHRTTVPQLPLEILVKILRFRIRSTMPEARLVKNEGDTEYHWEWIPRNPVRECIDFVYQIAALRLTSKSFRDAVSMIKEVSVYFPRLSYLIYRVSKEFFAWELYKLELEVEPTNRCDFARRADAAAKTVIIVPFDERPVDWPPRPEERCAETSIIDLLLLPEKACFEKVFLCGVFADLWLTGVARRLQSIHEREPDRMCHVRTLLIGDCGSDHEWLYEAVHGFRDARKSDYEEIFQWTCDGLRELDKALQQMTPAHAGERILKQPFVCRISGRVEFCHFACVDHCKEVRAVKCWRCEEEQLEREEGRRRWEIENRGEDQDEGLPVAQDPS